MGASPELGAAHQPLTKELTSWKEVVCYLDVSTRTAQRWEKIHGLPIRRLAGTHGRIRANLAELKRWKDAMSRQNFSAAPESAAKSVPMITSRQRSSILAGVTAMTILLRYLGLRILGILRFGSLAQGLGPLGQGGANVSPK